MNQKKKNYIKKNKFLSLIHYFQHLGRRISVQLLSEGGNYDQGCARVVDDICLSDFQLCD